GVWGSSIYADEATAEIDIYAGFKTKTDRINWDFGVIYYAYPGEPSNSQSGFGDYVELKVNASVDVWKGGTLSGTVFYSPDYLGFADAVATYEVSLAQALPRVGMFSPTVSATYGYSDFLDHSDASYSYWNVGVSLGFLEKWSVDLRYHDTDG